MRLFQAECQRLSFRDEKPAVAAARHDFPAAVQTAMPTRVSEHNWMA